MVDFATLVLKADTTDLKRADAAMDDLAKGGAKAEAATDKLGREFVRASSEAGKLRLAESLVTKEAVSLAAAHVKAAQGTAVMTAAMEQVNTVSRAQRANLLNLGRQVQDVGTMFALGAPPMQIFASQAAQIADVLASMSSEAKAADTSLTRMAAGGLARMAPTLGLIAVAAVALGGTLAAVTNRINETSEVTVTWGDVALGTFDLIADAAQNTLTAAFERTGIDIGAVWEAITQGAYNAGNFIINAFRYANSAATAAWLLFPGVFTEFVVDAANGAIRALEAMVNGGITLINNFTRQVNGALGTTIGALGSVNFGEIQNTARGAGALAARAFSLGAAEFNRDNFAEISPYAQDRARSRLAADAEKAGKGAGRSAGRAMGRAMGEAAAEEYPKAFLDAVAANLEAVNKSVREQIAAYGERSRVTEQAIAGLQRELEQLTLTEAELRQLEIARLMEGAATNEQRQELDRLNAAREEAISKAQQERLALEELEDARRRDEETIARVARNLGLLGGLFGQDIGGLVNSVLQTEIIVKDGNGKEISQSIGDSIATALEKSAPGFADTIGQAIQGAVIGGLASQAVFGQSGVGSSIGGGLGNVAGTSIFGKSGGLLGSLAGPLGGIAGGIVGGLIDGIFGGKERASATVSGIAGEAMQNAISGDNAQLRGVADSLASGLIGGLGNIAEALGGEIGSFAAISIGTRKGTFRVDANGQGKTANMPSFQTEAEAVAYALALAIERGAITGLRAGTEALLKGAADLEQGLAEALAFEDVFKRLEQETDPLGFALSELQSEFDELRKLFDKAGASAEEYAQLEQLYEIERQKALEQFGESVAENTALLREQRQLEARILELQGDRIGALALLRQLELEAAEATLRPLYEQIYALEDQARAAADAAAAQDEAARLAEEAAQAILEAERRIADERFGLETRYLNLVGDAAALRERELAAIDPVNQALLLHIFALEDAQAAERELARARDEAAQIAEQAAEQAARAAEAEAEARARAAEATRNLTIRLLEAEGNALAAVAMRREDELAGLSEGDRAILDRIFALEDQRAAEEAATRATQEATRAAEEKAQAEQRAADITRGLTIRLLEAQGNAEAALAIRRQEELEGLTASDQAIARQIFALEDAAAAQREYEEALDATRDAIAAQRSQIESELSPLRSELERLVAAVTPEEQDLLDAIRIRDVSSEGLALAAQIAEASKGILADNAQVAMMQRSAARRELFRMAETGTVNAGRIDGLIGSATQFGGEFADPVEQLRQQALTANALAAIAKVQEDVAQAEQDAEEARAARAREQVLEQIEALELQITQVKAAARSLDKIDNTLLVQREETKKQNDDVIASLREQNAQLIKQNEYLQQIAVYTGKSEKRLQEIELQGESA